MNVKFIKLNWKVALLAAIVVAGGLALAPRVQNVIHADVVCSNAAQTPTLNWFTKMGLVTVSGEPCKEWPTVWAAKNGVYPNTVGQYDITAAAGDTITVRAYVHNAAAQGSGFAQNVTGHVSIDTSAGSIHAVSAAFNSSNAGNISGNMNVITAGGESLQIVSGHVEDWFGRTTGDSVNIGANTADVNFGNIDSCFEFSKFIVLTVKVVAPPVAAPTGQISVTLGGQISGQCLQNATVNWSVQNVSANEVDLAGQNGQSPAPFATRGSGTSFSQDAPWIQPNTTYTFILYNTGSGGKTELARATVTGGSLNCGSNPLPQPKGTISVTLGGQISGQCLQNATVNWTVQNVSANQVFSVDANGQNPSLFASRSGGTSFSQDAPWMQPGKTFTFILYDTSNGAKTELARATVTGGSLNCGSACVLNANASLTNGSIVTISDGNLYGTTIFWSFTGSNQIKITYIDPGTNGEVVFVPATNSSGSQAFNSIQPNKNYIFKMYDLSGCGGVIQTLAVSKAANSQCVANTNATLTATTPVLNGSTTYSIMLTWSSSGSNQIKIAQGSIGNIITQGAGFGTFSVFGLAPGNSYVFYMIDANCGAVLSTATVVTPQPPQTPQNPTAGNCNNSTNSCNTNTNTNNQNSTGTNSANQNNQSNINGNNNIVTQTNNNCVNNSCNTYYINNAGVTVAAQQFAQLSITKYVRNLNGNASFQKTVSANNGDTVEFQITVSNNGGAVVNNVQLTDTANGGLQFISGSMRMDGSYSNDALISNGILNLGSLSSGQSHTIVFQARVYGGSASGSIQNIATARGDNAGSVQDSATVFIYANNIQPGNVNLQFSKKAWNETKNADAQSVNASKEDYITYTLTATNNSNMPAYNFVITDDLSGVMPYADMSDNGGGALSGNVISYPAITVPSNGSVSKSFKVRVKFFLADNLSYVMTNAYGNTVTVRINNPSGLAYVAPKTGADNLAFEFAGLLTVGFGLFKKRSLLASLGKMILG